MATPSQVLEAFQGIDVEETSEDVVQQTAFEVTSLIQEQLQMGETPDGGKIAPDYVNKYYANKKFKLNPKPGYGTPDLFVTGEYYHGLNVTTKSGDYSTQSNVDYAEADSITQYGDILKLSDENQQVYTEETFIPTFIERVEKKTGIVFD